MIFVNKDNIAVNKGIHESREVCEDAFLFIYISHLGLQ